MVFYLFTNSRMKYRAARLYIGLLLLVKQFLVNSYLFFIIKQIMLNMTRSINEFTKPVRF